MGGCLFKGAGLPPAPQNVTSRVCSTSEDREQAVHVHLYANHKFLQIPVFKVLSCLLKSHQPKGSLQL
ncbi:unnamed protein product [Menidia menidia]|uniref:(Atlantic silverside) hypothetical protein n=1 Tax=Menidia menidia TaxID=238744 RepID=A0A8S4BW63_9TELE|nr:unnamed protein product [Menidia menidia]